MHIIRQVKADDLPLIFTLERSYIEAYEPAAIGPWHRAIDRHLTQWTYNFPRMFVAEEVGQSVGYYFWEHSDSTALLASISVVPEWRRRGIGASLLRHFEQNAFSKGLKIARLSVLPTNPARHLYESAGYMHRGETKDYLLFDKDLTATIDALR